MRDGRRKGNRFEVDLAYAISDWVAPNAMLGWAAASVLTGKPSPFRRRPADKDGMPTDWVGGRDLIHTPSVYFPFSVEAKCVEGWSMDVLFTKPTALVVGWWEQCVEQAAEIKLLPLLVMARARVEPVAVLRLADIREAFLPPSSNALVCALGKDYVIAVALETLMKVPPRRLKKLLPVSATTGG
jgi:hypothetical protein